MKFVPTIVSRVRPSPERGVVGSEDEQTADLNSTREARAHTPGYEEAITPGQWQMLCHFLGLPLAEVLALPGPNLLKRTTDEIKRRDLRKRGYQV